MTIPPEHEKINAALRRAAYGTPISEIENAAPAEDANPTGGKLAGPTRPPKTADDPNAGIREALRSRRRP